jgi:hypothetical protein
MRFVIAASVCRGGNLRNVVFPTLWGIFSRTGFKLFIGFRQNLDPAIHANLMDPRVKPAGDECECGWSGGSLASALRVSRNRYGQVFCRAQTHASPAGLTRGSFRCAEHDVTA